MRRSRWLAIPIAAALLVSACSSSKKSDSGGSGSSASTPGPDLVLGYIGDMTGPNTAVEVPYLKGIQTAIAAINKAGGVNGSKIVLDAEDSHFDVATATAAYRKLIATSNLLGIIGINSSSAIAALVKTIDQDKVPIIAPSATTTESLASPNFYNIQASLDDQASALTNYLKSKVPNAKVATTVINVASGTQWQQLMSADVPKVNGTVVTSQKIDAGAVEASSQVSAIKSSGANVVLLHSNIALGVVLGKAMQSQGVNIPIYSSYGAMGDQLWQGIGSFSYDKVFAVNGFAPSYTDVPGRAALQAAVQAAGVSKTDSASSNFTEGWVTGNVVAQALKKAGKNVTRDSFVKALQSPDGFDTGGYSAKINWSSTGSHPGVNAVRVFGWDSSANQIVAVSGLVTAG